LAFRLGRLALPYRPAIAPAGIHRPGRRTCALTAR
jgi:hypothetical protein